MGRKKISYPDPSSIEYFYWVVGKKGKEIFQIVKERLTLRAPLVGIYYQRDILWRASGFMPEDEIPNIPLIIARLTIDCPWGFSRGPDRIPFPYLPDPYHDTDFLNKVVIPNHPDYLELNKEMIWTFSDLLLSKIYDPLPFPWVLHEEYRGLQTLLAELKKYYLNAIKFKKHFPDSQTLIKFTSTDWMFPIQVVGRVPWKDSPSVEARRMIKERHPEIKGRIQDKILKSKKSEDIKMAWQEFAGAWEENPPWTEEIFELLTNPQIKPLLI